MRPYLHGDAAWRLAMQNILVGGHRVSPRGLETREILSDQLVKVDAARPVVTSPSRKLSYQFMAAEALWILDGSNKLADLLPYAPSYGKFSDDGVTLAGAYGPKIMNQVDYVVDALLRDRDTRQAVLSIWERRPAPSKDIPCTLDMTFSIRDDQMYCHTHMRSSDVWLGVPYDMFSFSMVLLYVTCRYNMRAGVNPVDLGGLSISMVSSHMYAKDYAKAEAVLDSGEERPTAAVPQLLVLEGRWDVIRRDLELVRAGGRGATWWVIP